MTCNPSLWYVIPEAIAQAAQRAFPKGNRSMTMFETLGSLFTNPDFADLYAHCGRPAEATARLALVLVFQQIEQLSDAEAAEAVHVRLDWKYALALEIDDPGFDATILGDFRTRLLATGAEERLLTIMLDTLVDAGLLKARGRQRSDSTHVLDSIRTITRLTLVAETLRHALNDLAAVAPDWLAAHVDPTWSDRYAVRVEEYRLPKDAAPRQLLVETIGQDGYALLRALGESGAPPEMVLRPAMQTLRTGWIQQSYGPHDVRWHSAVGLPPHALLITSPYDAEARFATKQQTSWHGYKVHLSETCEADAPQLITNVETTPATTNDVDVTDTIHRHLSSHGAECVFQGFAMPYSGYNTRRLDMSQKYIPVFHVGDSLRLSVKVPHGNYDRVQVLEGIVICRDGIGPNESFTIRRIAAHGIGVEHTFNISTPTLKSVELIHRANSLN